ncbi:hypothetical protein P152DRAFT_143784 [Eremomyces bilateralis CBS 781.70]|uniref:Uncharacterized protein n=1 Tax=Eremomyces bilateralis CBS 781.70 TaxID=1392243 RepID=A0A6G1FWC7_9PEZI|nr:uncharacterized protein P152DRAFT_143784 [Eremomyces bilateralis CBS 781.70]KAF1809929.1 hypothetical protein P152DRAFT_143784 [Eremomyces bilateralis CBS 781.70]
MLALDPMLWQRTFTLYCRHHSHCASVITSSGSFLISYVTGGLLQDGQSIFARLSHVAQSPQLAHHRMVSFLRASARWQGIEYVCPWWPQW